VTRSNVELALSLGTFLVTIGGLLGLFLQLRSATRAQIRDHERQRKQATLDAYMDSVEHRVNVWKNMPNDRDVAAVRAFCPRPDDTANPAFDLVVAHLNFFENFAVGAQHDVYDPQVIDALVGDRLVGAWLAYEPFIKGRRELMGTTRVWEGLETLAKDLLELRLDDKWVLTSLAFSEVPLDSPHDRA
jgi:hypothetical protein